MAGRASVLPRLLQRGTGSGEPDPTVKRLARWPILTQTQVEERKTYLPRGGETPSSSSSSSSSWGRITNSPTMESPQCRRVWFSAEKKK